MYMRRLYICVRTGKPCPAYAWSANDADEAWGECDSVCGGGTQRRLVQCHDTAGDVVFGYDIPFEIVADSFCTIANKPAEIRVCNAAADICGDQGECGEADGLRYCKCRSGYDSEDGLCLSTPSINRVMLSGDTRRITDGFPTGDVVDVTWAFEGSIGMIDIYLEPAYDIEDPANDKALPASATRLPQIVTSASRYPNVGKCSATLHQQRTRLLVSNAQRERESLRALLSSTSPA